MRSFFYMLMLFAAPAVYSQTFNIWEGDTINRTDIYSKKQGKWVLFGDSREGECFAATQKVEEGNYSDNKKTGLWIEYYCSGTIRSKVTFVNGRPNGPVLLYHENGKISEEGTWRNNRWIGNYRLFYDNGQVQHEFEFSEAGRREGKQKYFYENGQLAVEGNFENGRESGLIREYYENGDLKAEKNYNNGAVDENSIQTYQPKNPLKKLPDEVAENAPVVKVLPEEKPNEAALPEGKKLPSVLNGKYVLYNRNRQVTKDGIFKDNRFMEGKAYIYNDNGILQRIALYRNGLYVGDEPFNP